jgi:hypothetical protein
MLMEQWWPAYMHMMQTMMTERTADVDPMAVQQQMMQSMAPMMQMAPLFWLVALLGLFVRGVLIAAVLRAVLEPDNKGFFYLRVGMQEVWQCLVALVMFVLIFALAAAGGFVGIILTGIIAVAAGKAAIFIFPLVMLALVVVTVYAVLRLSLAPALTFHEKTFRVFESWSLTRGHVGALFGILLILMVIVWVIEFIVGGAMMAFLFSGGGGDLFQHLMNTSNPPDVSAIMQFEMTLWSRMTPFIMGAMVVGSLLSGAAMAVFLAPFATVYQQLTAGAAAPATPTA